jgi:hypothetical protein
MELDFEIFKGKTFSNLCKDIVRNSENKKNQINILISDLKDLVKTVNDAVIIIPLIKDYYDVSIKNDDHLVKLAAIVQKLVSKSEKSEDGMGLALTAEEQEQLMREVQSVSTKLHVSNK